MTAAELPSGRRAHPPVRTGGDPVTTLAETYDRVDASLAGWMARHGVLLLRLSLGIVFFWFGFLKFFPGLSPAQTLAGNTMSALSFGLLSPHTAVLILAVWECLIGIGLLTGLYLRATLFLLWLQMLGTITPLFLFPNLCFASIPFVPTLEGQYIIKNLVLISAGLVIGATVRGGRLTALRTPVPASVGIPEGTA
jgi:uncharacterized membrane protein YphA (DoxX/SURF4 family)